MKIPMKEVAVGDVVTFDDDYTFTVYDIDYNGALVTLLSDPRNDDKDACHHRERLVEVTRDR